jgi:hypothetical protein
MGDEQVLSPSDFADELRKYFKGELMLPPSLTASVSKKKEWLARGGQTAIFSARTADVEKAFARAVAIYKKTVISIVDKLRPKYVGFEGMSWEEFKAATLRCLFPLRDDDVLFRHEVKRTADRATGYFNGIIKRERVIDPDRIEKKLYHRWWIELLNAGAKMETTKEMITAVSDELRRAKQEMQDLANEVTTVGELVSVKLAKQLDNIRNKRGAVTRELQDVLIPLKALRTFFDEGGDQDVNRLEKLNALCSQLEGFHRSGALSGLVTALQTMSRAPA